MSHVLMLIVPPVIGVGTYIVLELWEHHVRKIAVKRRNRSADRGLTETGRVYGTLNQSKGTTDVGFRDGSRRRHMPDLTAPYRRAAPPRRHRLNKFRTLAFSAVGVLGGFVLVWYLLSHPWPLAPDYFWGFVSSAHDLFK